ncbi:unnamed protein product [Cuscuta campestris]|uniref:Uncharacterized protein n=1 Tax=Cuscuta campestris TaxID=132261 RepID=A0A484MFE6_9ASTE|nr:unnamed protein product [Cuscuta campestris]
MEKEVVSGKEGHAINDLTDMAEVIQRLSGEEMDGADLAKHPPPGAIGRENHILVVISNVLGAGVRRPAGEVRVVGFQELRRHGGGGGHHHVHGPQAQVHYGPVLPGQARNRLVRLRAQVREVADDRPRLRPRRQREGVAALCHVAAEEIIDQDG